MIRLVFRGFLYITDLSSGRQSVAFRRRFWYYYDKNDGRENTWLITD